MGGCVPRAINRLLPAHESKLDRRPGLSSSSPFPCPHLHQTGNKKDNVNIVYTPWSNLKKDGSMAVGQVGFRDQRKVKKVLVETRTNVIVNRLNKTKTEKFPDLAAEREERDRTIRDREKKLMLERVCILFRDEGWREGGKSNRVGVEEGGGEGCKGEEGEGVAEGSCV